LLGRLGDRLRVALTPSFLQSNLPSTSADATLSSCNVEDYHTTEMSQQPVQKESTQLIEVEVMNCYSFSCGLNFRWAQLGGMLPFLCYGILFYGTLMFGNVVALTSIVTYWYKSM